MIQQIERQFVRTARPLYGHLVNLLESAICARRAAVGLAPAAGARARAAAPHQPHHRRQRLPRARSRAGCCAAMSAAARSCARRRSRPGRRSRGAARSPRRRCGRATRRCATRSATRPTRGCCRSRPASRRSTAFRPRRFSRRSTRCSSATRARSGGTARPKGNRRLREAIAERFGVPAESVLVLAGAQQGLDLLARCLVDPGDAVIIDRPGYLGAIQSFRAAGAKLIGWDVARADIDELEDLLRPLSAEADLHEPDVPESRPA